MFGSGLLLPSCCLVGTRCQHWESGLLKRLSCSFPWTWCCLCDSVLRPGKPQGREKRLSWWLTTRSIPKPSFSWVERPLTMRGRKVGSDLKVWITLNINIFKFIFLNSYSQGDSIKRWGFWKVMWCNVPSARLKRKDGCSGSSSDFTILKFCELHDLDSLSP